MPMFYNSFMKKWVEAFRMGEKGEPTPAPAWFPSPKPEDITTEGVWVQTSRWERCLARWGHWVVKDPMGELWIVDDKMFAERYELVEEGEEDGDEYDTAPPPWGYRWLAYVTWVSFGTLALCGILTGGRGHVIIGVMEMVLAILVFKVWWYWDKCR